MPDRRTTITFLAGALASALIVVAFSARAHPNQINESKSGCVGFTAAEDHERLRRLERLVLAEHHVEMVPSGTKGKVVTEADPPLWKQKMLWRLRRQVFEQQHIEQFCGLADVNCERMPCQELDPEMRAPSFKVGEVEP